MAKIRVGVLIDQLLPGGVQKAAIQEVQNLRKINVDASLVILMRKGFERPNSYLVKNIPYQFLSDRYPKIFQKSFKLPIFKFLSTLHLIGPLLATLSVRTNEFDLIVSHGTTTSLTIWPLFKFRKIPYIAIIHDPMIYILEKVYSKTALRFFFPVIKPVAGSLENRFVRASRVCLVDSSVHASYLQEKYHIEPQILYLGISSPKIIPKKRGKNIVSFGRWDKEKNLQELLNLIKELEGTKLIIAGSWSNKSDLNWFKNLVLRKKLSHKVILIPHYRERDLAKLCSQARLWIHPNFEAFSLSALEAASYGLPIIIPKRSGITELFVENKHGYFPENLSIKNLKYLTEKLLNNERLAYQMGYQAALLVKNKYTPEVRAVHLKELIEKIVRPRIKTLVALETGHIGETGIAGGDVLLEKMVKYLKMPIKISVIVPQSNISHWLESKSRVELMVLKKSPFDKYTGPWGVFITYIVRIISSIKLLIKTGRVATIIYSSTGIFPDVIPAFIAKLTWPDIIWIARIHHLSPPPSKRPGKLYVNIGSYALERLSLKLIKAKADVVIALNRNLKNQLEALKFKSARISIIGGGVNYQEFSQFKSRKKTAHFDAVFLGRLHPAKGIFDIPVIWKEIVGSKPNSKICIIGPGEKSVIQNLKKQIRQNGLDNNITIVGFLDQNKVISTLKNSEVFFFTDHEAGWGLAVGEAMAAGLPVIGWDIGILGNVFKSGFIKIPTYDFDLFANKAVEVLNDHDLYQKLSAQALQEAKKLDWALASQKFNSILENLRIFD